MLMFMQNSHKTLYYLVLCWLWLSLTLFQGNASFKSNGLCMGCQRLRRHYNTGTDQDSIMYIKLKKGYKEESIRIPKKYKLLIIMSLFKTAKSIVMFWIFVLFLPPSRLLTVIKPVWKYGSTSCRQRKDQKPPNSSDHRGACGWVTRCQQSVFITAAALWEDMEKTLLLILTGINVFDM